MQTMPSGRMPPSSIRATASVPSGWYQMTAGISSAGSLGSPAAASACRYPLRRYGDEP